MLITKGKNDTWLILETMTSVSCKIPCGESLPLHTATRATALSRWTTVSRAGGGAAASTEGAPEPALPPASNCASHSPSPSFWLEKSEIT